MDKPKVVILAGGLGSRLAEETDVRPKPLVEIGGRPLLWHIMKHYAHFGFNEFFVALGYRGEDIKRYFLEYYNVSADVTIHLGHGKVEVTGQEQRDDWIVHTIDTGLASQTGGRIKRLQPWLGESTFMATYGDGVSDLDLPALLRFHREHGKLATITAVRPPARYGGLVFDGDMVMEFTEKPQVGEGWINGGFMVLEPGVFDYLVDDSSVLEQDGLERLAADHQLMAFRHDSYWQCIDTLREKRMVEGLWQAGNPPWKLWE